MRVIDRLANLVSGLGTSKDKSAANAFASTLLTKQQLDAAYRGDWLSRKIIDIPPFDMTREWRNWQAEEDQIEKLEELERRLQVRNKVAEALVKARLYGGAALFMGTADQNAAEELRLDRADDGFLRYLHVLSAYELSAGELDRDPLSPYFGQPIYYEIQGDRKLPIRIHPSRVIQFIGAVLPDQSLTGEWWGDSVLQIVYDAVQNAASAQQHVASLLPELKVDVITVPGLSEYLSTDIGTKKVQARFSQAALLKSLHNTLLLEGDGKAGELWQQKQINFAAFPDLIRLYLQVAAGAADIPVTRLLGQSPLGLNATGESDLRNYYDGLSARQNFDLRPRLDRLDEVLIRSALGTRPPEVYYEFNPLWQLSEKEAAEIDKLEAETDHIYAVDATIPSPVLEQSIRNRLIERGRRPGIEQAYSDFDKGILKEPESPGSEGVAAGSDFDEDGFVDDERAFRDAEGYAPDLLDARRGGKAGGASGGGKFEEHEHPRGPGGKFASKGEADDDGIELRPVAERAFGGRQIETTTKLTKQEAGSLGERIALSYLQRAGYKNVGPLNMKRPNFPLDMAHDGGAVEVKTGLVSNGPAAQQWRATIGQPGKAETEKLKAMSPEDKAKWNKAKQDAILKRKTDAHAEVERDRGRKLGQQTIMTILNPDTQVVDVYLKKGYSLRVGWNSAEAKSAYVGSFRYGHKGK